MSNKALELSAGTLDNWKTRVQLITLIEDAVEAGAIILKGDLRFQLGLGAAYNGSL